MTRTQLIIRVQGSLFRAKKQKTGPQPRSYLATAQSGISLTQASLLLFTPKACRDSLGGGGNHVPNISPLGPKLSFPLGVAPRPITICMCRCVCVVSVIMPSRRDFRDPLLCPSPAPPHCPRCDCFGPRLSVKMYKQR